MAGLVISARSIRDARRGSKLRCYSRATDIAAVDGILQSHAAALECTILLLTNGSEREVSPEYTMVDGVIHLEDALYHQRTERTLQVGKFRGSDFLPGRHPFRITSQGLEILPRVEAAYAVPSVRDAYWSRRPARSE